MSGSLWPAAGPGSADLPLLATMLTLPGALHAELCAAWFDMVWIDLEHGPLGRDGLGDLLVGAAAAGTPALVRVPSVDSDLIPVALDAGAAGVVVPNVAEPAVAAELVARTRHAPAGRRGFGPRRANGHGRRAGALPAPMVGVQIESAAGVAAAEAIARVDGIDLVVVGTADLSYDLGVPGEVTAPPVADAVRAVADACRDRCRFGVAGPASRATFELWSTLRADMWVISTEARLFTAGIESVLELARRHLDDQR